MLYNPFLDFIHFITISLINKSNIKRVQRDSVERDQNIVFLFWVKIACQRYSDNDKPMTFYITSERDFLPTLFTIHLANKWWCKISVADVWYVSIIEVLLRFMFLELNWDVWEVMKILFLILSRLKLFKVPQSFMSFYLKIIKFLNLWIALFNKQFCAIFASLAFNKTWKVHT